MRSEHEQKEREYGIPWRSAFKVELKNIVSEVVKKLSGGDGSQDKTLDDLAVLLKISGNGYQDAHNFYDSNLSDLLVRSEEKLKVVEQSVGCLKRMLKEPDFS